LNAERRTLDFAGYEVQKQLLTILESGCPAISFGAYSGFD
jgi:hypothetical protein